MRPNKLILWRAVLAGIVLAVVVEVGLGLVG